LAVAVLATAMAVHGRWNVPVAAWVAPLAMLRYVRLSGRLEAILVSSGVGAAAGLWWAWQTAVPLQLIPFLGVAAMGIVVSAAYAADACFDRWLSAGGRVLFFPAVLATTQYLLATFGPFGSAFGLTAVTQHDSLALLQLSALTGPVGITVLIGLFATVGNALWEEPHMTRRVVGMIGGYAILVLVVLVVGATRVSAFAPTGATVRVASISPSPDAAAQLKELFGGMPRADRLAQLDPSAVAETFSDITNGLFARTREAAASGARIVMWSEQAANVRADDLPTLIENARTVARSAGIYLQTAAFVYLPNHPHARNVTHLFSPAGELLWSYDKSHPIPGLEPYPAGPGTVPVVTTPFGRLATVTCFDADFPALARVDADILLVPARDWPQIGAVHHENAQMRAVENGYSVVRQAEFGINGGFDYQGRSLAYQNSSATSDPTVIYDVPVRGQATPYRLIGDWLGVASVIATVLLIARATQARHRWRRNKAGR
jgi:apolipoprotein N-acyltransferase